MKIRVFEDGLSLANEAAAQAAAVIAQAIEKRGRARILIVTGASQLQFLDALNSSKGVDWSKVEMFHLDEYMGISRTHQASFCNYLIERFVRKTKVGAYHLLDGEAEPESLCREIGQKLSEAPVDVAFAGIGENSHLAFSAIGPMAPASLLRTHAAVTLYLDRESSALLDRDVLQRSEVF